MEKGGDLSFPFLLSFLLSSLPPFLFLSLWLEIKPRALEC